MNCADMANTKAMVQYLQINDLQISDLRINDPLIKGL
jgi:hypothetical protein